MKTTVTFEFNDKNELTEFCNKINPNLKTGNPTDESTKEGANSEDVFLVMKDGHEGEAPTMDNIKGICVPMLNGERFLVYPKCKELPLLEESQIEKWDAKNRAEFEALYHTSNHDETSELLAIGSPAAKFVREYGMDIASPLMAIAMVHHRDEIIEIANKIAGADAWNKNSSLWSCCRYYSYLAWYANGIHDYFSNSTLIISHSVVPVAQYKP